MLSEGTQRKSIELHELLKDSAGKKEVLLSVGRQFSVK